MTRRHTNLQAFSARCVAAMMVALTCAASMSGARAQERKATVAQIGIASVYAKMLHGGATASGERHDSNDYVAAHRTLRLGSSVRVTNLANHRWVIVRINDRGPQLKSRIIDLSPTAAAAIGLQARGRGLARVRLDVLPRSDTDESEDTKP
jgi:rare lipoprotein A